MSKDERHYSRLHYYRNVIRRQWRKTWVRAVIAFGTYCALCGLPVLVRHSDVATKIMTLAAAEIILVLVLLAAGNWQPYRDLAYIRSMRRAFGPLIWPKEHDHDTLAEIMAGKSHIRPGCPACIALYTHRAGCGCGRCDETNTALLAPGEDGPAGDANKEE